MLEVIEAVEEEASPKAESASSFAASSASIASSMLRPTAGEDRPLGLPLDFGLPPANFGLVAAAASFGDVECSFVVVVSVIVDRAWGGTMFVMEGRKAENKKMRMRRLLK